ncbi:GNAT family N-acetyltransferase [Vibrio sp. M60_M31a]
MAGRTFYWGRGYATEASKAIITFGKSNLGLSKLHVMHLLGNERSKSVIKKLGVTYIENRINRMQERREKFVFILQIFNLCIRINNGNDNCTAVTV